MDGNLRGDKIFFSLKNDLFSRRIFKNVVSRDDLPFVQNITYPSAYIINTDKSNEPGSHWLAIYYTNTRECYFFVSIGMGPRFYDLTGFLKSTCTKCYYNNFQIQKLSAKFCGNYCVYFIKLMCRRIKFEKILSLFDKHNLDFNDFRIKFFSL